ncbi:MAG: hypothetical protein AB8B63_02585 [Granulosicoccus sp.]
MAPVTPPAESDQAESITGLLLNNAEFENHTQQATGFSQKFRSNFADGKPDKSTLTNPVLGMPFITELTATFYKRAGFAGGEMLRLVLELAKSTLDALKTERTLELAKRTLGTQAPNESA